MPWWPDLLWALRDAGSRARLGRLIRLARHRFPRFSPFATTRELISADRAGQDSAAYLAASASKTTCIISHVETSEIQTQQGADGSLSSGAIAVLLRVSATGLACSICCDRAPPRGIWAHATLHPCCGTHLRQGQARTASAHSDKFRLWVMLRSEVIPFISSPHIQLSLLSLSLLRQEAYLI